MHARRDVVATAIAIAFCVSATMAAAQAPVPLPNQKDVDRILNPRLPEYENPLDKRIKRGLDSLGLPPQTAPDGSNALQEPAPEQPGL